MNHYVKQTVLTVISVLCFVQNAWSQTGVEDMTFGVLLQNVFEYQEERAAGSDGFDISTARLFVSGQARSNIDYFLQADFARDKALLDARVRWTQDMWQLDVGQFRVPFGAEFLIGAESTDFINRSAVVRGLAPGRQIGVSSAWQLNNTNLSMGVYNGNGIDQGGNNNKAMLISRVSLELLANRAKHHRLQLGASVAYSDDEALGFFDNALPDFTGSRSLAGVDVRYERDAWMLSGEAIWAKLNDVQAVYPYGYHLTAGYMINPKWQVLLRRDVLDADDIPGATERAVILGTNWWINDALELQANISVPDDADGFENFVWLGNFQVFL